MRGKANMYLKYGTYILKNVRIIKLKHYDIKYEKNTRIKS